MNYTHTLDEEARHVAYIVTQGLSGGVRSIEPTEEAERQWVAMIVEKSAVVEEFLAGCTPGYYNDEGKARERSRRNAWYGGGSPAFFKLIADWRLAGNLPGMEVVKRAP